MDKLAYYGFEVAPSRRHNQGDTMAPVHLSRFPVLGPDGQIVGYDLQVRSHSPALPAAEPLPRIPEKNELVAAIGHPAFGALGGGLPLYFRVSEDLLADPAVRELVPGEVVVCFSGASWSGDAAAWINEWRQAGGAVAVDVGDPQDAADLSDPRVDLVRLDVGGHDNLNELSGWLSPLAQAGKRLMAVGVHDRGVHDICRHHGIRLFVGQFFAQAVNVTTESLPAQTRTLFRLFNLLGTKGDVKDIAAAFQEHPQLTNRLLAFVNSGGFRLRREVESVRQALVMLGQKTIQKWVALLLYSGDLQQDVRQPLLEESMVRGRLMELAAEELEKDDALADDAFIVGALSVLQPLLGRPLDQLVKEMGLDREVTRALIDHEGDLGQLLDAVTACRRWRDPADMPSPDAQRLPSGELAVLEERAVLEIEELESGQRIRESG